MKKLSFFIFAFLLIGCGGGGGGDGGGGHPPSISNLEYTPRSATLNAGGGSTNITGSLDFQDSGGDVSSVRLKTFNSANNVTNDLTTPISGASGVLAGTIILQAIFSTTQVDVYRYEISSSDSRGSTSNTISGYFPITLPPSSNPTVLTPGYSISLVATGLGATTGVTTGPTGDIFVADHQGGRILKVDQITHSVSVYSSGISFPNDLDFDIFGRLFVNSGNNISQVLPDGTLSLYSSGHSFPTGVKARSDGSLFIANGGDGTISRISPTGVPETYLSGFSVPHGPFGLSFDSSTNLYFADHGTGRIIKVAPDKSTLLLATLVPFGPAFTALDQSNALFVSDSSTASIYRISGGAVTLFASGFTGKSSPPVIGPSGIKFVASGNMYVADGNKLWVISSF